VHGTKAPVSREHWNVELASLDENVNVALVLAVVPLGPELMVVFGAVVSAWMVQLRVAGVPSLLPARSVARTRNVRKPAASPV
jgi:hypothetical protein